MTLRYWASVRAAAGVAYDVVALEEPASVAALRRRAIALHPGAGLERLLATCSVLIDDRPLGTADPEEAVVGAGHTVEFLPPFAGG